MKLPTAVLYEPELSDGDKVAYAVLANYAWTQDGHWFPMTAEQLATLLGKSKDRAELRTRALERAGWLKVQRRRGLGRPNLYRVVEPRFRGIPGGENAASGSRENAASGSRENAAVSTSTDRAEGTTSGRLGPVDNRPPWCGTCDSPDYRWRPVGDNTWERCGCDAAAAF